MVHSGAHRGQTETLVHAEAEAEAASWFPLLCFIINSCGSDCWRQKLPERTLCIRNHKRGHIRPSLPVLILFVLSEMLAMADGVKENNMTGNEKEILTTSTRTDVRQESSRKRTS